MLNEKHRLLLLFIFYYAGLIAHLLNAYYTGIGLV